MRRIWHVMNNGEYYTCSGHLSRKGEVLSQIKIYKTPLQSFETSRNCAEIVIINKKGKDKMYVVGPFAF